MKKRSKKSKSLNKTVNPAKSLMKLMKDEDGFVSKDTILKVGLSTVASLGAAGALTEIATGGVVHTNSINTPGNACAYHTNVTTHSSY